MALLALKIFRSEKFLLSGILITICGFLSVYTIPTNIYFLIGLGGWVFSVFIIPDPNKLFFKNKNDRKKKCIVFIFKRVFVVLGVGLGKTKAWKQKHQRNTTQSACSNIPRPQKIKQCLC